MKRRLIVTSVIMTFKTFWLLFFLKKTWILNQQQRNKINEKKQSREPLSRLI